ncbi:hypothetical protein LQ51_16715 [Micromonospora sp. HK10]|nr:hypothetical protein LQ51_16715 [Micromonospora sp. HK10]
MSSYSAPGRRQVPAGPPVNAQGGGCRPARRSAGERPGRQVPAGPPVSPVNARGRQVPAGPPVSR